jgi:hypothetical protein
MYTLIQDEGIVLDTNGVQVAPCQSINEPNFIAYIAWIEAGNTPTIIETRG